MAFLKALVWTGTAELPKIVLGLGVNCGVRGSGRCNFSFDLDVCFMVVHETTPVTAVLEKPWLLTAVFKDSDDLQCR